MKILPVAIAATLVLAGCKAKVIIPASPQQTSQPDKVVEKNTTIVNPPGQEDKKTTTTTTTTDSK